MFVLTGINPLQILSEVVCDVTDFVLQVLVVISKIDLLCNGYDTT